MTADHGSIAPLILWYVWCSRNKLIFEGKSLSPTTIAADVSAQLQAVHAAFGSPSRESHTRVVREVAWHNAGLEFMVLNVDGSLLFNPCFAGFGSLVRNHLGEFMIGFYGNLGATTILEAELHAISMDMRLCWEEGYRDVHCFSDSLLSVQLVQHETSPASSPPC